MIRVVVVEDVDEVRDGLIRLLETADSCTMAGAYRDAEAALGAMQRIQPDVVLMDIGLPGMDGIEATRRIREAYPSVQLMILTVYEDEARIFESLRVGATGYVLKSTPPALLLSAIEQLHAGGSPMSHSIARKVVHYFHQPAPPVADASALTAREQEILDLLVHGFRYREIGDQLGIKLDTVRTHIRNVYEKMHVRSRAEATALVLRPDRRLGRGLE